MDALKGIWLTLKTPRLWPFCLGPLFGAVLLYILLGVGAGYFLVPRLEEWLQNYPFWARLAQFAALFLWIALFPLLFTLLGGVFFGLVFEPLSRAVEKIIAPNAPEATVRLSWAVSLGDTAARLGFNGTFALMALVLGLFLGPIAPVVGVLAAAIVGLLDYTSPAYLRRGLTLGPQRRHLFSPLDGATLSFGLLAGLLSLVPFVGVLLMPGLIAGGTLLAHRRLSRESAAGGASNKAKE